MIATVQNTSDSKSASIHRRTSAGGRIHGYLPALPRTANRRQYNRGSSQEHTRSLRNDHRGYVEDCLCRAVCFSKNPPYLEPAVSSFLRYREDTRKLAVSVAMRTLSGAEGPARKWINPHTGTERAAIRTEGSDDLKNRHTSAQASANLAWTGESSTKHNLRRR